MFEHESAATQEVVGWPDGRTHSPCSPHLMTCHASPARMALSRPRRKKRRRVEAKAADLHGVQCSTGMWYAGEEGKGRGRAQNLGRVDIGQETSQGAFAQTEILKSAASFIFFEGVWGRTGSPALISSHLPVHSRSQRAFPLTGRRFKHPTHYPKTEAGAVESVKKEGQSPISQHTSSQSG